MEPKKKRFINPFFIALPILVLFTVFIMYGSYWLLEQSTHQVSKQYLETAESDILQRGGSVIDHDSNTEYRLAFCLEKEEWIAFRMDEDTDTNKNKDTDKEIEYCAGSYYPRCYWQGESSYQDLSSCYEEDNPYVYPEDLYHVRVYDFSAYKGYESYLGNGGGLLLVFIWMLEAGIGLIVFLTLLVIGIVIQIKHRKKRGVPCQQ